MRAEGASHDRSGTDPLVKHEPGTRDQAHGPADHGQHGPGNGTDLVVVPVSLTVEAFPDIAVDPASMSSSLLVGMTDTQVLTISNNGMVDLLWEIFEEPAESLPAPPGDQPPVTRFNSQAAQDSEQSGLEEAEAQNLDPRDPAAAARAR